MSSTPNQQLEPILNKQQLVDYLVAGCKPKNEWRIGTEHEKFLFYRNNHKPLTYDGINGIRHILTNLSRFGWKIIYENDRPIALQREGAAITLEPGGQFELSGAPLYNLHQTHAEFAQHFSELEILQREMDFGILCLGFQPKWKRQDIDWMPKARYQIMREYMPKKGKLGIDMMLRTCTVQANLDFASEHDMVRKFRLSMALQPVVTAIFANSPFFEGKNISFQSYRSWVWTDTDPDRSGILDFVFKPEMSFERYVDYLLSIPMYFVYRDGQYINVAGESFLNLMHGRLKAVPGSKAMIGDWVNHLTVAFPEVRLKRYLEMRGADCVHPTLLPALPALWVGLLYDDQALDAAEELISTWSVADIKKLRLDVPKFGLHANISNKQIHQIAKQIVMIAHQALQRRNIQNQNGVTEGIYLEPLINMLEKQKNPALIMLDQYETQAHIDQIFTKYGF